MSVDYNAWVASLNTATIAGTETLLVVQSAVTKKVAISDVAAYTATVLAAASAVNPVVAGDAFALYRGGVAKKADIDVLSAYILSTGWSVASEADPAVSGDMILANRAGTIHEMDVDTLAAFALDSGAANTPVTSVVAGDDFFIYRGGSRKLVDVAYIASYVVATAWSSDAVTTLLSTDTVLVGRSAASKQVTLANLEAQFVADKKTSILDISGLSAATLGATDTFLVNQSGVSLKLALSALETKVYADFAAYAAGLPDAATVADANKFYCLQSGSPKYATATEIAAYVTSTILAAPTVSPWATGDLLLLNRSGVTKQGSIDDLATYINNSAHAAVLNLSGLDSATIGGSDLMLFCQTTTGRQATVSALTAYVCDAFTAYTAALNPITSLADADTLYCIQGGAPKKLDIGTLSNHVLTNAMTLPWTTVAGSKYTATPAGASTLTMSDTSDFKVGSPVRYIYLSTTYYGIVTAISTNASITIAGAPLDTGHDLASLSVGIPQQVEQVDFHIAGAYGGSTQDLLAAVAKQYCKWQKAKAFLVSFSATHGTADTGAAQPYVNVKVNGNLVSTNSSNHGVQASATPGTWADNPAVAVASTYYVVNRGNAVEVRCTVVGTNGNAADLTVSCVFVYE